MRRILVATVLCASLVPLAHAKPEFLVAFNDHYKPAPGSPAEIAQCKNCHTDPPAHNEYGKAVQKTMAEMKKASPDADVFAAVEKLRTADGKTFADEMPQRLGREPAATAAPASPAIPAHSFHPTIVHFPIALFLFGAFLEVFGKWRRSESARSAAWPCLLAGALSSLPAVALGLIAAIRLGYGLAGKAQVHMFTAMTASAIMLSVAAWRRRGPIDTPAYWPLLLLGATLVGLAGHLGGLMVFG